MKPLLIISRAAAFAKSAGPRRVLRALAPCLVLACGCGRGPSSPDLDRGIAYLQKGENEDAARRLERAARRHPDSASAFCNLGVAYWRLGRNEKAAEALRMAADLDGTNAAPYELLGQVSADMKRWDEARKALSRANELAPNSPRILTALSVVEFRGGDKRNAHLLLYKALTREPNYPPALYNLGVLYREHYTNQVEALRCFQRYLTVAGTNRHAQIARTQISGGRPLVSNVVAAHRAEPPAAPKPAPAIPPTATVTSPAPVIPPAAPPPKPAPPPARGESEAAPLVKRARTAIQNEEYDEALVLLNDAMRRDARNPDAVWELALLYDKRLQYPDKAAVTYRRFKQLFPNDPRSRLDVPTNLAAGAPARPAPAPPSARPAAPPRAADPGQQARAVWHQALAQYRAGNWNAAITGYQRALELDPRFADAAYNLGFAFKARGDARKARDAFEQAVRLKPEMVEAEYMLGVICRDLHEPDAAIEHATQALDKRPAYPEAHLLLGMLYRDAMRYDLAQAHFKRAVQLAPDAAFAEKARTWLKATTPR